MKNREGRRLGAVSGKGSERDVATGNRGKSGIAGSYGKERARWLK